MESEYVMNDYCIQALIEYFAFGLSGCCIRSIHLLEAMGLIKAGAGVNDK